MNNSSSQRLLLTLMAFLLTWFGLNQATAHKGATGIVKERMDLMKQVGKDMKSLKAMVRGNTAYDPQLVGRISSSLGEAAKQIPGQFPEGSLQHPTEARPQIWQRWDKFTDYARQLEDESLRLRQIAASGDRQSIQYQFRQLNKTCLGCHKSFRKKKKKP
ncbi:MAG: cytochrome c [Gammaproteobacteria bacterium]|nr:cytochrome c [Gammaproteobacteria bacterium]